MQIPSIFYTSWKGVDSDILRCDRREVGASPTSSIMSGAREILAQTPRLQATLAKLADARSSNLRSSGSTGAIPVSGIFNSVQLRAARLNPRNASLHRSPDQRRFMAGIDIEC